MKRGVEESRETRWDTSVAKVEIKTILIWFQRS